MLVARGICKRFGRTVALDRVDFHAAPGEIHALIGENGAGKSTLVSILAGRLAPDAGTITGADGPLRITPGTAHGVAAVFQAPLLFEQMSWEENLALGGFRRSTRLRPEALAAAARAAHDLGFALPVPGRRVADLAVGERVRLAILRALSFAPRVLLLDEPTGALAPAEVEQFLDHLGRLRRDGRAVVLVTHRLGEALTVADRITVLRRGRKVAEVPAAATNERDLATLMVGELPPPLAASTYEGAPAVLLSLADLMLEKDGRRLLDGVTMEVRRGEIVGVAGVEGNGQDALIAILAGLAAPTAGRLLTRGALALIPQDRDLDGLILEMPLWENLLLLEPLRCRFAPRYWLRRRDAVEFCRALLARYAIRAGGPHDPAAALSGGNRQRLAVARALATQPEIVVAHDIARGLDLAATRELHRQLRQYAESGRAVLLLSSDLEEIFQLCSRSYLMSRGRLRPLGPADRQAGRFGLMLSGAQG